MAATAIAARVVSGVSAAVVRHPWGAGIHGETEVNVSVSAGAVVAHTAASERDDDEERVVTDVQFDHSHSRCRRRRMAVDADFVDDGRVVGAGRWVAIG